MSSLPTVRLEISLHGTPFLVLAAFVRDGAGCQGSTWADRAAGMALTASTTTFTTMAARKGARL